MTRHLSQLSAVAALVAVSGVASAMAGGVAVKEAKVPEARDVAISTLRPTAMAFVNRIIADYK